MDDAGNDNDVIKRLQHDLDEARQEAAHNQLLYEVIRSVSNSCISLITG